jgi:fido (protein-threonine AMPylation protein)
MSSADDLQSDIAGVTNGQPETWRQVLARHQRNIGDIVNDPNRGAWNSTHNGVVFAGTFDAFEQIATVAEQISWVHKFSDGITRDTGDVLIELMEFAIQWRKANNLPTSAK